MEWNNTFKFWSVNYKIHRVNLKISGRNIQSIEESKANDWFGSRCKEWGCGEKNCGTNVVQKVDKLDSGWNLKVDKWKDELADYIRESAKILCSII